MPLYEYHCDDCRKTVEILVRSSAEQPECPACGSGKLTKQLSVAASPAIAGQGLPTVAADSQNCGRPQCGTGCMFD